MLIKLGEALIISKSTKQQLVTKSSTESELVAVSDSISFIIGINNLLKDLNFKVNNWKINLLITCL